MAHVVGTAVIEAPIERVFEYRLDVKNLTAYNPSVTDLRPEPEGAEAKVGARYVFRVRLAPFIRVRCTLTIVRVERPIRIEFSMSSLFDAREVCAFEPVESGRATRLRFETWIETSGGWIGRLLERFFVIPFARSQIERELGRMRDHLSTRSSRSAG